LIDTNRLHAICAPLFYGASPQKSRYHYYQHPGFGLLHVRVQTWFPFTVDVCLNGREWLARQMDRAGIDYEQRDNCFARVGDPARAQALLDEQLKTDWPRVPDALLEQAHPLHVELGRPIGQRYYWSANQAEFATDVMFRDAASLAGWYLQFMHHGIRSFGSADMLRFLGSACPNKFRGEVATTLKRRPEGVRLKHVDSGNSLKVYDKQGSVLRVETTINNTQPFRFTGPAKQTWDNRHGDVCDGAWPTCGGGPRSAARPTAAILGALGSITGKTALAQEARSVCRAHIVDGQRYRALTPWSPSDEALLEAISRGEFALNGLRNRDLRALLYPAASTAADKKRQSAAITRQLALLRAHGVLKKVTGAEVLLEVLPQNPGAVQVDRQGVLKVERTQGALEPEAVPAAGVHLWLRLRRDGFLVAIGLLV
jgi:hypothetical protein